jgi:hypothetical protein
VESVVAKAAEPAAAEEIFPRGLTQERPRGKVSGAENGRLHTHRGAGTTSRATPGTCNLRERSRSGEEVRVSSTEGPVSSSGRTP